jgi:acyl carrier protein
MEILETIRGILAEILDIEPQEISAETYVVRELNAESIDFLELAVALNDSFKVEVDDHEVFLSNLRLYLNEVAQNGGDRVSYLMGKYPFLTGSRIVEILTDLDNGPALKVKDLVSYVAFRDP